MNFAELFWGKAQVNEINEEIPTTEPEMSTGQQTTTNTSSTVPTRKTFSSSTTAISNAVSTPVKEKNAEKGTPASHSRSRSIINLEEKDGRLPLPATASSVKRARIEGKGNPVKVHWAKFIKRMSGPGSGSNISESLLDFGESVSASSYPRRNRPHAQSTDGHDDDCSEEVEQIVVDNVLMHSGMPGSVTHSDHHTNPEAGGYSGRDGDAHTETHTQATNVEETIWERFYVLTVLRWRIWPALNAFFCLRFFDPVTEDHYCKETWYQSKNLALWGSAFVVVNWALSIAAIRRPTDLTDQIFYYGVCLLTVIPLPFMIIYDFPRRRPVLYQVVLVIQTWQWSLYTVIFITICGFYSPAHKVLPNCNGKDFIGIFYNTVGLPAISLFALRMNRLAGAIGASIVAIFMMSLILPEKHTWYKNLLNFIAFHAFILYVHYKRETAERRLFSLRDQLKIQFKATQKAQVSERKAADSKRRLTSYIFHVQMEVRVPLNTALLAVQNMEATGAFERASDENIEFAALEGSLSMMSKVLNDVLDFNRLDAGKFESVSKPYNFHTVLRSMLAPLGLASQARGLTLETDLDDKINEIVRRSYYTAKGYTPEEVNELMRANDVNDCALVLGDEIRLRQVITNLTSNATKFTPEGGRIRVVTKLLWPQLPAPSPLGTPTIVNDFGDDEKAAMRNSTGLSSNQLYAHNLAEATFENIVVRIEVHDTGVGIKAKELIDHKLFSPYVQTEIGKFQGGKGTGLGLALVRRIVKLSGGRLGVKSKLGVGSNFWVELNMGVGRKVIHEQIKSGAMFGDSPFATKVEKGTNYIFDGKEQKAYRPRPGTDTPHPRDRLVSMSTEGAVSSAPQTPGVEPPVMELEPALVPAPANIEALKNIMEQRGPLTLASPPLRSDSGMSPPLTDDEKVPAQPWTGRGSTSDPPSRHTTPPPPASSSIQLVPSSPQVMSFPSDIPSPPPSVFQRRGSVPALEKPMRCLVVDDDSLTRKLMSRMLKRLGCVVETAQNGQVALEMIVTVDGETTPAEGVGVLKYDIIFLDNQMPVMSGIEAVSQLRDAGRKDFVVGVTGNAMLSDQEEYIEAGVNHVLTKPVLERSLKAMLALANDQLKAS